MMQIHIKRKILDERKIKCQKIADELEEIKNKMLDLIERAQDLLNDPAVPEEIRSRAESYWISHIITSLTKDSEYLSDDFAMEDTINELRNLDELLEEYEE